MDASKKEVHDYWNAATCGEAQYLVGVGREDYLEQARIRYELEPHIMEFAEFEKYRGKKVLEIGVGLGADHQRFAEAGALLYGIDLTERAIEHTRSRLDLLGLDSKLQVADVEDLPFEDESFDLIYSWGVLHHTPDIRKAIDEIYRVLKPGGELKVMIYHKRSLVGYMLWVRYALMRLRPGTTLDEIYGKHLESPGTKAYSIEEAESMLAWFKDITIRIAISHGDLLTPEVGRGHRGYLLTIARTIWPRKMIQRYLERFGLFMMIVARK